MTVIICALSIRRNADRKAWSRLLPIRRPEPSERLHTRAHAYASFEWCKLRYANEVACVERKRKMRPNGENRTKIGGTVREILAVYRFTG